ncbi:TrmH family RNA methyltransferase [Actinacidiphila sp. bgisy167]|uniref:TrmH family RNA methyltransferase n=1 Tax=Actinacidiphila sp. bgisy167 TaxID=3413797 RepID=UPI003D70E997
MQRRRDRGAHVFGLELADEAVRPADLPAARRTTVVVLGHEQHGIPPEALDLLDLAVGIPTVGTGAGLDIAAAGSPALCKPADRCSGAGYPSYAARSASRTALSAAARSSPRRRARWA